MATGESMASFSPTTVDRFRIRAPQESGLRESARVTWDKPKLGEQFNLLLVPAQSIMLSRTNHYQPLWGVVERTGFGTQWWKLDSFTTQSLEVNSFLNVRVA